jgi:hypothetical protein
MSGVLTEAETPFCGVVLPIHRLLGQYMTYVDLFVMVPDELNILFPLSGMQAGGDSME